MRRHDGDDVRNGPANHRRDRPRLVDRVGKSSERLAVWRVGSAAAAAPRLAGGRLPEALAPELHRDRQPARQRERLPIGSRPRDWQFGVSVQQQLLPRVSLEVGYLKRWLQNFTATDNLLVNANDFTPFIITAPTDSRLPNNGGYPIDGLYNVVPGKFGQTSNNITLTDKQYQSFNGMLLSVSARIRNGLTWQGGINSGKQVTDYCALRSELPELSLGIAGSILSTTNPYCRVDPGLVTKVSGVGS